MKRSARWALSLLVACCALAATARVQAGGYDTPILYSARQLGMGGTAVAYVHDPSALFHNPAGLAYVGRGSVLVNASPLIGHIKAPIVGVAGAKQSETTFAPFFLAGGALRLADWVVAGFSIYPVASAGAEFKYSFSGNAVRNSTELLFVEAAPGLGFNLPYNIHLGASYRITYASVDRFQGIEASPGLDFNASGLNFLGFRLGAQWHESFGEHHVKLGAHYRHKTVTELTNDKGRAIGVDYEDIAIKFTLPSRFSFGARYDFRDFGIAYDAEYALNQQNKRAALRGTNPTTGDRAAVYNYFNWQNAWTLRTGLEYRLLDDQLPVRIGYIYDQKTANERFPTQFGTPPGPSHIGTVGCGWNAGPWQVNAAYAYRRSQATVTPADIEAGSEQADPDCSFCGPSGKYELVLHGFYLDFSYDWH
jgi:long-subunit fatty acid transport protein